MVENTKSVPKCITPCSRRFLQPLDHLSHSTDTFHIAMERFMADKGEGKEAPRPT